MTPREIADDLYAFAIGCCGLGKIKGLRSDEMREAYRNRLAHVDKAIRACDAAIGSPRVILREPDDTRLKLMKSALLERHDLLASVLSD